MGTPTEEEPDIESMSDEEFEAYLDKTLQEDERSE
jgi:hypothetical protein